MYINLDDVTGQLEAVGLILDKPLRYDASIQRWKVDGEDHERRGWSRLKEWTSSAGNTYVVGDFGIWHGADDGRMRVEMPAKDDSRPVLSKEDIAAMHAAHKEAQRRLAEVRKNEAKTAARWAASVWSACSPCTDHDYLATKQIRPNGTRLLETSDGLLLTGIDESNNFRLRASAGALVVPMHDEHGNICGLQFVYQPGHPRRVKTERSKEFWPSGMAMGGIFGVIGQIRRDGVLLVTEGFATAASLHEATGQAVAYAFSANNLTKAGKLARKQYPRIKLLFCADDDYLTPENPGVAAAVKATAEIEGSAWIKPDFLDESGVDRRDGKKLTDFNDLAVLTGLPLILANQINSKLDALGWRDAAAVVAGGAKQGEGDRRRAAVAVMALDDAVARFFPLDDGTGKYVFDTWTNKIAMREQMVALLPAGVRSDDIKRHPEWVSRGACYLDQVGFDPSGNDSNVILNTWRGWPLTPKKGSCHRLLGLLRYLCDNDENSQEVFDWLLCWMAYPLQHPGAKMASAVIMHGPQGTGKSTVFQALAKIYGDYATVLNQRGLEDRFNSDWSDSKLFILAEEVVARAEMWHIKNELKALVTDEWIRINPKNIAAYRQRNHLNIIYLSNENQPLPLENDDRRHLVIWTPPMLSEEFYDDVFIELENGGVEAFYDYLLNIDLNAGKFHPKKRPPMTQAKHNLIAISQASEGRFISEWAAGDARLPVCPCLSDDLYAAYLRWCRKNGEQRPRPSNQFFGYVQHLPGWEKKKCRVFDNLHFTGKTECRQIVIPPQTILEQHGTAQTADKTTPMWLTESYFAFANAEQQNERYAA